MAFYISGPKFLFETTEISTHPNSTQQESNYIYLYTTKFGTSIKIRLNRKFESTEFETMRVNCMLKSSSLCLYISNLGTFWLKIKQFWLFEEISIFSNSGHLGWSAWLSNITFKGNHLRMIQAKFGLN